MKILLACEFYHPSRGGVQEVMRQIAERLVSYGHDVTVATTKLEERSFSHWNGVKIVEFAISGNRANGIKGDVEAYVAFLKEFQPDAFMIKAAQQWTFDAAWEALDAMTCRKVFIPCGFSGLYLPEYQDYFRVLPDILAKFDTLIFYAESYRDIDFAKDHGLTNIAFLPNGASESEFVVPPDPDFRARHGIGKNDHLLITVGTPVIAKGQGEVAAAFSLLPADLGPMTLILNGQWPELAAPVPCSEPVQDGQEASGCLTDVAEQPKPYPGLVARAQGFLREQGLRAFVSRALEWGLYRFLGLLRLVIRPLIRLIIMLANRMIMLRNALRPQETPVALIAVRKTAEDWILEARAQEGKQVLKTHWPREEVVQAFLNADLFVFASHIEYSPLVLFESCAAGLPFVTVPVGNAEEILRWTGGGVLCPAERDSFGFTRVDPGTLASTIEALLRDPDQRRTLGAQGRAAWMREYNWNAIARRYEAILQGLRVKRHGLMGPDPNAPAPRAEMT